MLGFWVAAFMVFIAEVGDKSQLLVLCFASRYKVKTVILGISLATLLTHFFSALIGHGVNKIVPIEYIGIIAGITFVVFGFWTIKDCASDEESDTCNIKVCKFPVLIIFTTFLLAELGDKTMLSTITLAAKYNWIVVWLGAAIGMIIADLLAVLIGIVIGKKLPEKTIRFVAAIVFFIFGVFYMLSGLSEIFGFKFIRI